MVRLSKQTLARYKIEASRGSLKHTSLLSSQITTLRSPDQTYLLKLFSRRLREQPPSFSSLQECTSVDDPDVSKCHYVRLALLATYDVVSTDANLAKATAESLLRKAWPSMWNWISGVFLEDPSSLPLSVADEIYTSDPTRLQASLLSLCIKLSETSSDFAEGIRNTPGLLPHVAKIWFASVQHPFTETSISCSATSLMRLCLSDGWNQDIIPAIGSARDFAACCLGHLRRSIRQDYSEDKYLRVVTHVLASNLPKDVHLHLVNQNSVEIVIELINYYAAAECHNIDTIPEAVRPCGYYLLHLTHHFGRESVHLAFRHQVIPALLRASRRRCPTPVHTEIIVELLKVFTKYLVYRSNLRWVSKSLRIIEREGLEPCCHETAELEKAWHAFHLLAQELLDFKSMLSATERCCMAPGCQAERPRLSCSGCGMRYCNRGCQAAAWNQGNHRKFCARGCIPPEPDYEFFRCYTFYIVSSYDESVSLLYQRHALRHSLRGSATPNDVPPLVVVVNFTSHPITIIASHPDDYDHPGKEYVRSFGESKPGHARRRFISVFLEIPVCHDRADVPMSTEYDPQPMPDYVDRKEFLELRGCDAGDDEDELVKQELSKIDIALKEAEVKNGVVFQWVSPSQEL